MGRDNKQKLELAKKMAEKINARKGDGKQSESQATAEAVMKGLAVKPAAAPTVSNKLLADQIAAKLNAKLGHVPMDRNETEQQAQVRNHKYFQKKCAGDRNFKGPTDDGHMDQQTPKNLLI